MFYYSLMTGALDEGSRDEHQWSIQRIPRRWARRGRGSVAGKPSEHLPHRPKHGEEGCRSPRDQSGAVSRERPSAFHGGCVGSCSGRGTRVMTASE
jgi:hypothetical protein